MKSLFLEPARDELKEAVTYYEDQRNGLGQEFADEIERTIERIMIAPTTYEQCSEDIYSCRAKRFPYSVLYTVRDGNVLIVAVMHMHRKPGYWKDRLP